MTVVETWDTLGMRATQSHDTILDGVFVPDARIGRVVPAGDASDPFIVAMAMWPLSLIATVYLGVADRALELAVSDARRKSSIAIERGAYAYNPRVQHQIAEMFLELDAAAATVDRFVDDWVAGADHDEAWVPKVYSMKWRAVEASKRVVDVALDVTGGAGMFRSNELERLYRDVRCGGSTPATTRSPTSSSARPCSASSPTSRGGDRSEGAQRMLDGSVAVEHRAVAARRFVDPEDAMTGLVPATARRWRRRRTRRARGAAPTMRAAVAAAGRRA